MAGIELAESRPVTGSAIQSYYHLARRQNACQATSGDFLTLAAGGQRRLVGRSGFPVKHSVECHYAVFSLLSGIFCVLTVSSFAISRPESAPASLTGWRPKAAITCGDAARGECITGAPGRRRAGTCLPRLTPWVSEFYRCCRRGRHPARQSCPADFPSAGRSVAIARSAS